MFVLYVRKRNGYLKFNIINYLLFLSKLTGCPLLSPFAVICYCSLRTIKYFERSEKDLVHYLESKPPVVQDQEVGSDQVLCSDIKDSLLQQFQEMNSLPLVFLCKSRAFS